MKSKPKRVIVTFAFLLFALGACGEDENVIPVAQEPTRDAIGYYCNMIIVDHQGPKGQIHLKGDSKPLWFASARDTIAFTLLPEESKAIGAIFVNDMGQAANWDSPEAGTWIDARNAWYVMGSSRVGGMGAPEAVPFSEQAAAQRFAEKYGGMLAKFGDIPQDFILGSGLEDEGRHDMVEMSEHATMAGHEEGTHDQTH